jgi:hypothetical protein
MKFVFPLLIGAVVYFLPETASAQGILGGVCSGTECSACDIAVIANSFISWLIGAVMVLFAVLMVIAGFGLVTSGGNPDALSTAKSKFTNAIIGLIIVLSAWLIVDTLMKALVGESGQVSGNLAWSEIQCMTQTVAITKPDEVNITYIEANIPDLASAIPQVEGTFAAYSFDGRNSCQTLVTRSFSNSLDCQVALSDLQAASLLYVSQDCNGNPGTGTRPSWFGAPTCGVPPIALGDLAVNQAMGPIFDPAQGGSNMVLSGAAATMQRTLDGPFARLQAGFGRQIVINDAIAKSGTSRETQTPGSRHFQGDALDLSTAGMSNADKIRLYEEARRAGFTGFGFGNNILHVDLGASRAWAYGNSTYGGRSVCSLGVRC